MVCHCRTNLIAHVAGALFLILAGCAHVRQREDTPTAPPESSPTPNPESSVTSASATDELLPAPRPVPATESAPAKPGATATVPALIPSPFAEAPAEAPASADGPTLPPPPPPASIVWGIVGLRGFPFGEHVASNGVEFNQLFSLDLDFNIWLWRRRGLYAYSDSRFWGQKAAPGITNPKQGAFDFSKREFDFTGGAAWNYYGFWEARVFAYSYNNLNRGMSQVSPSGFNDGIGLENRYYLNPTYAVLGTPAFDKARATFLSLGYYPTKDMVDGNGNQFKPGPFARAYLIWELYGPRCYLFTDDQFIADKSFRPTLFYTDSGIAVRPFHQVPRLEFRLGTENTFDLRDSDKETSLYLSMRYIF